MKKLRILLPVALILLGSAFFNTIQVKAEESPSLDNVIEEIKTQQGIIDLKKVDCNKVSDKQLEQLGEAVMGVMFPDQDVHELMDNMMGGEGSASLASRHIFMGSSYLGCYNGSSINDSSSLNFMGRMGGMMGMMSGFGNYQDNSWGTYNSMMGITSNSALLTWVVMIGLVLIGGVILVVIIVKAAGLGAASSGKKWPLERLRERYANGEIDKAKYEEMVKELARKEF